MLRTGFLTGGPTALASGTLEFRDGCIWLMEAPGASVLVLWPHDADLDTSAGAIAVTFQNHRFAEGDRMTLGGGEEKDLEHVRSLVGSLPDECITDRYWLTTTITPSE